MKRLILIANWLYLFSLALWVGGMFLLGILVEAVIRINQRKHPESFDLLSHIMNVIMDVFNVHVVYWCMGLMVFAVIVRRMADRKGLAGYREPRVTRKAYTKEVLLAIMVVLSIYIGSFLRPQMHELDRQKKANPAEQRLQIQFNRLHTNFELVWFVNMILGLSLFYIHGKEMTRFRDEETGGAGPGSSAAS